MFPFDFYPETEWRDDLELGATELANALSAGDAPHGLPHDDAGYYLRKAAHWANAYITGPNDAADTLNLYDVSGLAHYELYRALGARARPARARHDAGRAARRPEEAARRRRRAGGDRPVPVRLHLGRLGHDVARRRPLGDGERVRRADGDGRVRRLERPLAREHPRRERMGRFADRRRRHDVPALHAAPGGEPRRLARRLPAAAARRGRRGAERRDLRRRRRRDAALSRRRRRHASPRSTTPRSSRTTCSRSRPSSRRSTSAPPRRWRSRARPPGSTDLDAAATRCRPPRSRSR